MLFDKELKEGVTVDDVKLHMRVDHEHLVQEGMECVLNVCDLKFTVENNKVVPYVQTEDGVYEVLTDDRLLMLTKRAVKVLGGTLVYRSL